MTLLPMVLYPISKSISEIPVHTALDSSHSKTFDREKRRRGGATKYLTYKKYLTSTYRAHAASGCLNPFQIERDWQWNGVASRYHRVSIPHLSDWKLFISFPTVHTRHFLLMHWLWTFCFYATLRGMIFRRLGIIFESLVLVPSNLDSSKSKCQKFMQRLELMSDSCEPDMLTTTPWALHENVREELLVHCARKWTESSFLNKIYL